MLLKFIFARLFSEYMCVCVRRNEHTQPQTSQSPFCHEGAVWLLLCLINTSHLWTTVTQELCFSPSLHPYLTFLRRPTPSPLFFLPLFPIPPVSLSSAGKAQNVRTFYKRDGLSWNAKFGSLEAKKKPNCLYTYMQNLQSDGNF